MKVSIITVVFNNRKTILDTIESVNDQKYNDKEYIIIDGGSTDGTIDILKNYDNNIDIFISEKDRGMYDAINKGISVASGDVIGLLHSDDVYTSENTLSRIANTFFDLNVDSTYGDLIYIDRHNPDKIVRKWKSGQYERSKFLYGWMPPHPTFFVKRHLFNKYGYYDLSFKNAADYELMLRFLYKYKISTYYIPEVLVKMRTGGKSNESLKNRLIANGQDNRAWKKNDLAPRFYTRYLKPLHKISQFIGN